MLAVLSEYDEQPQALYSLIKSNLNYVKILTFLKYFDHLYQRKRIEQKRLAYHDLLGDIKTSKKNKLKIQSLVKIVKSIEKRKKGNYFAELIKKSKETLQKGYFFKYLKRVFFRVKKEHFKYLLNKMKKPLPLKLFQPTHLFQRNRTQKRNGSKMFYFALHNLFKKKLKTAFLLMSRIKRKERKEKVIYGKVMDLKRPREEQSFVEGMDENGNILSGSLYRNFFNESGRGSNKQPPFLNSQKDVVIKIPSSSFKNELRGLIKRTARKRQQMQKRFSKSAFGVRTMSNSNLKGVNSHKKNLKRPMSKRPRRKGRRKNLSQFTMPMQKKEKDKFKYPSRVLKVT